MIVFKGWSNKPDRNMLDPLLEENGFWIEFRGGDVLDPVSCCGSSDWFGPNYPKHVIRFFASKAWLPWISWKIGGRGGYIGFKAYGADSDAYKNWMPADDVYDGSRAMCFSIRPFASIK